MYSPCRPVSLESCVEVCVLAYQTVLPSRSWPVVSRDSPVGPGATMAWVSRAVDVISLLSLLLGPTTLEVAVRVSATMLTR